VDERKGVIGALKVALSLTYLGLILRQIVTEALRSGTSSYINGARAPFCTQQQKQLFMSLRIYNTLSRAVANFTPLEPGHVRMYVCGMTVYDFCHVGHARSNVAFDVVQRWLKASGYKVTHIRNITDIDDKIIKRAVENKESIRALTDRMIDAMHQDFDALGIARPTAEPRATEFVPQMLSMIGTLEEKGLAYTGHHLAAQKAPLRRLRRRRFAIKFCLK
jgi:Mg2+ and Co2+ transporter CorA